MFLGLIMASRGKTILSMLKPQNEKMCVDVISCAASRPTSKNNKNIVAPNDKNFLETDIHVITKKENNVPSETQIHKTETKTDYKENTLFSETQNSNSESMTVYKENTLSCDKQIKNTKSKTDYKENTLSSDTQMKKTETVTYYQEKTETPSDAQNYNNSELSCNKEPITRTEPSPSHHDYIEIQHTNCCDKTEQSRHEFSDIMLINHNKESINSLEKQELTDITDNYSAYSNGTSNHENHQRLVQNHTQHSLLLNEDNISRPSTSKEGWSVETSEVDTRIKLKRVCTKAYQSLQYDSLSGSEIDNTDSDPDFNISEEYRTKRNKSCLFNYKKSRFTKTNPNQIGNLSPCVNESTVTSNADSTDLPPECIEPTQNVQSKGRKRKSNPLGWKSVNAKTLRNSGQQYISKSNKIVPARAVGPACGDKCRIRCKTKINEEERK